MIKNNKIITIILLFLFIGLLKPSLEKPVFIEKSAPLEKVVEQVAHKNTVSSISPSTVTLKSGAPVCMTVAQLKLAISAGKIENTSILNDLVNIQQVCEATYHDISGVTILQTVNVDETPSPLVQIAIPASNNHTMARWAPLYYIDTKQ